VAAVGGGALALWSAAAVGGADSSRTIGVGRRLPLVGGVADGAVAELTPVAAAATGAVVGAGGMVDKTGPGGGIEMVPPTRSTGSPRQSFHASVPSGDRSGRPWKE
jgi:hypothetical protein